MATLTKKLNILPNGGGQVSCSIYSTTTEVGANYVPTTVDGVNGYIPIGSTSDTRATKGRVTKSSTTYAILTSAKPAYTEKSFTTAGTHTFTVPAGITRIRVAVCGGGGGSTNGGNTSAGNGGSSSFGSLISVTGGTGGKCYSAMGGAKGNLSYTYGVAGVAGSPNGNAGTAYGYYGSGPGGAGFALGFSMAAGSYGKGGDDSDTSGRTGASGGSGGYNTGYFNVTPGTTYTITVGSGGAAGTLGRAGASGFVLVAYGGDI